MSAIKSPGPLLRSVPLAMALWLLAACGGLRSNAPAEQIYVLQAAPPTAAPAAIAGVLVVARPEVLPGLDTERIALTRAGNELDYFAASRWSGSLAQMLGALARQSLDGSFATVGGSGQSLGKVDFELLLTVRQFAAAYGDNGAPVVRVALECVLVTGAPRRVLGSCDADVREPAAANRMGAIVQAFERAAQRALAEVRAQATGLASRPQAAGADPGR